MFGALVTGAITATAVLFWIRGMLVQLSANELSSRVMRGYLNDTFLHLAFAFLVAVFAHAIVALLWLPADDAEPVPAATALSGALLATLALLLIVHAVHDSVQAMNPSRVLTAVTTRALEAVRERYPEQDAARVGSAAPDPAGEGAGRTIGTVTAPDNGWVVGIDHAAIAEGLPPGGVARLEVHESDFVTRGSTIAVVSTRGDDDDWDSARVASAFVIRDERDVYSDAEHGLDTLVALALHSIRSGTADRSTAFEALRCISVLLDELLRREPLPPALAFSGDRVVVRRFDRSHADIVRATVGELREHAGASSEFGRAVLADFRRLASKLEHDGFEEAARLVDAQVQGLVGDEEQLRPRLPADGPNGDGGVARRRVLR